MEDILLAETQLQRAGGLQIDRRGVVFIVSSFSIIGFPFVHDINLLRLNTSQFILCFIPIVHIMSTLSFLYHHFLVPSHQVKIEEPTK